MTNKEISEIIFNTLKKEKFTPYNISYGDTYFIFTGNPNSVIHFQLKGVNKHWKFGMWINAENLIENNEEGNEVKEEPVVRFFCQWDTNIDKFKPSASSLCETITNKEFDSDIEDCWNIIQMVKFIKKHKLIAYCGFCGEYAGYYTGSFLGEFLSTEWHHKKQKIKKAWALFWSLPLTKLKIALSKKSKIVKSIELYDFEKNNPGWSTSYLYEVRVNFTMDASDDAITKWVFKWFPRRNYGKFGYYDYVISADYFHQEGVKGCFDFQGRK